jgi:hypothetical protein
MSTYTYANVTVTPPKPAINLAKLTKAQLIEMLNTDAPAPVASAPVAPVANTMFAQVSPVATPVASAPVAPRANAPRAKTGTNIGIPKDTFLAMVAKAKGNLGSVPNRPGKPDYITVERPDGARHPQHAGLKVYNKPGKSTVARLNGFATSDGHLLHDIVEKGIEQSIAVAFVHPTANVTHPFAKGRVGLLMSESSLPREFAQTLAMQGRGLDHSGNGFISINGSHMPRVNLVQAQAPAPVVKDVEDTVTINGRTYVATVA